MCDMSLISMLKNHIFGLIIWENNNNVVILQSELLLVTNEVSN